MDSLRESRLERSVQASPVPADFPVHALASSLAGRQPKFALTQVGGKFVLPEPAAEEARRQYEVCEDMAHQLVGYCRRKLAEGKITTREAALERCMEGLRKKKWFTPAQNAWVVRRTAVLLGWEMPEIASDGGAGPTS